MFTGHEREYVGTEKDVSPLEGLDYMHARYYSPIAARFLSVDPVGAVGGGSQQWNKYTYNRNNPIRFIDPNGKHPVLPAENIDRMLWARKQAYDMLLDIPWVGPALAATYETFIGSEPSTQELMMDIMPMPAAAGATKISLRLGKITNRLRNIFRKDLSRQTIRGAAIESQGGITKIKIETGARKEHMYNVMQGREGAVKYLEELKEMLKTDKLTTEQRNRAEELLSQYSKELDDAEEYFHRVVDWVQKEKAK
jgi:RHS repeat-associated protein